MSRNLKPKNQMKAAMLVCALASMSPAFAYDAVAKADNFTPPIK